MRKHKYEIILRCCETNPPSYYPLLAEQLEKRRSEAGRRKKKLNPDGPSAKTAELYVLLAHAVH